MLMFTYTCYHLTHSTAIILLAGNSFSDGNLNNSEKIFVTPSVFSSALICHLEGCQLSYYKTIVGGLWVPPVSSTFVRHR